MTTPRILYVNQTSKMSGAEASLLTLLDHMEGSVQAEAACPEGDFADALRARRVPVHLIQGTEGSFRLHPRHTSRAVKDIGVAAGQLIRLWRRNRFDLIHANTTRAGVIGTVAGLAGGPPVLTHVRDWAPQGSFPFAVLTFVRARSCLMIANSAYIAGQLPAWPASTRVEVVHNAIDAERFDPDKIDRDEARRAAGLEEHDVAVGVVAQLTPWKGQADAIRAVASLLPRHPRLRLLLAGSAKFSAPGARFDNRRYAAELEEMRTALGVEHAVRLLGERSDVPAVLRALDVLLVPSWQEAFGRIAVEGMAMGLPVIASSRGGLAEIVRPGVDGYLVPPRAPEALGHALEQVIVDPALRARMGREARIRALSAFTPAAAVADLLSIYGEVLDGKRATT